MHAGNDCNQLATQDSHIQSSSNHTQQGLCYAHTKHDMNEHKSEAELLSLIYSLDCISSYIT